MDSSESQSDEDETPNTIGSKAASSAQAPAKRDEFTQDMDPEFGAADATRSSFNGQSFDIKHSSRKSSFQKFLDHSKRAIKKTVASFICLAFMLLMSFVVSSYEYYNVHDQYQRVYDDVAKKLAHAHSGRKHSAVHQNTTIAHPESTSDSAATDLPEDWRNQSLSHSKKMQKPKGLDSDLALAQTTSAAEESEKPESEEHDQAHKKMKSKKKKKSKKHKKKHHEAEEEAPETTEQSGTQSTEDQDLAAASSHKKHKHKKEKKHA